MHPCCGGSLQRGTKIIAIVSMVCCIILILIVITGGSALASGEVSKDIVNEAGVNRTTVDKDNSETSGNGVLVFPIVYTVLLVISLVINIMLLVGANKRNRTLCMVWFIHCAIGLVIGITDLFISFSQGPTSVTVGRVGGILLSVYFMSVVWAFISELKEQPRVTTPYANS